MSWGIPIASHGITEAELREVLTEQAEADLGRARQRIRAERLGPVEAEHAVEVLRAQLLANIEQAVPLMLRDMALTACAESLH